MKGAREYANLFQTGQYGRFYITSGKHARGYTFRIQILPEGEIAKPNGEPNICLNSNAVLVYGVVSGQLGWSEAYDWIYKGKWVDDFNSIVREKKEELEKSDKREDESRKARISAKIQKELSLLELYK